MLNGKAKMFLLKDGLIKKKINELIFSRSSGERVKVELDLSNYVAKADLINATGFDTSKFAEKVDLESLKSNVQLDIDKLKNTPTI